jgi:lipid A ethanolaminephosphotransferase
MRNQKDVRYLITPANGWWSLASVIHDDLKGAAKSRVAIGLDAKLGPAHFASATQRSKLVVLVVGETARGTDWGLNGYSVDGAPRNTTPELAQLPVVNFPKVRSCGTNTEVSVPCMFAPVGRRNYDEDKIRGSESLLHVLARAGIAIHWRDNQSGCKGVCDGLSNDHVKDLPGAICEDGHCLDEGLLIGLDQRLKNAAAAPTTQVLVLHQLGNHGPAYFKRYPPAFERFTPVCKKEDLRLCSRVEIVNAFDNALLYTDHLLAQLVRQLQSQSQTIDSALIYLSDHGESLGENNIFLHGMPYSIAPNVQTWVPMIMWQSAGFEAFSGAKNSCLQKLAVQPVSHDHLFHTVLGLLNVETALYDPAWDIGHPCRAKITPTQAPATGR